MVKREKIFRSQAVGFRDFAIILLIAALVSFVFSLMGWFSVGENYLAERSVRMIVMLLVVVLLHGYLCTRLPEVVEHGVSRRRGIVMLSVNMMMVAFRFAALVAERNGAAELAHLLTSFGALPSLLLMLLAVRALQLEPKPENSKSLFEEQADAMIRRQQLEHEDNEKEQ